MRVFGCVAAGVLLVSLVSVPARAAEPDPPPVVFDGTVPDGGPEHFFLPFQVPAGIEEIEIRHDDKSPDNVLDFGLNDPDGYRGWGGGTGEKTIVGKLAASRAYVPGPMTEGTWKVVVGKAKVVSSPALYHAEVIFRRTATLAPQTVRRPYQPVTLKTGRRWYAGDFHTHSKESTDARPDLDEMATFSATRNLDFIEISDHNTITQMDFFDDAQARHPNVLLVPGAEYTTYHGHANAVGITRWVDHKLGQPGVTIEGAADAVHSQGGLLSINHPMLDLDICIGCGWKLDLNPSKVDAIEIESGGFKQAGFLFTAPAMGMWESMVAAGHHIAALGGSDSHDAGRADGQFDSPIGDPVTLVLANELSAAGIVDGIKRGRTVVKLWGPADPMVELTSEIAPRDDGDTVFARSTVMHAKVTGGMGSLLRIIKNKDDETDIPVTSDPFEAVLPARAPADGEDRFRAEVLMEDRRHTVTSYLFVRNDPNGPDALATSEKPPAPAPLPLPLSSGGGCAAVGSTDTHGAWPFAALGALSGALLLVRRRRRR
jgi:MYXO-CTERM domain-containing protein